MRVIFGADQGGYELKNILLEHLYELGYEIEDLGINEAKSIDYPDIARDVCRRVLEEKADFGVICCGTGIGVSIAANKIKGIRAAHLSDCFSARMAREHNNANIITFGGRTLGSELAVAMMDAFISASFAGGRHQRRVDKIMALEREEK